MLVQDLLPPGQYLFATLAITLCGIFLLTLTTHQRRSFLQYLHARISTFPRRRRVSSAKTPPHSISPENKVPNNGPPPVDYVEIFPPSSREALVKVAESWESGQRERMSPAPPCPNEFRDGLIPLITDFRECGPSTFTPMEISMEDIRALGDFPDYAGLSGVPLPTPYKEFKIEAAMPRPYRPFRWAYHQTMSLTKLETDWWLELDKTYVNRIAERKQLFAEHGKLVLDYLPGSELGCKEIMEMALQFLAARYPQHFSLCKHPLKGHVFYNGLLKSETVINSMHPLHVLLENVPEDFAVMLRSPEDGMYYFRAGVICSSLGWNVSTKIGLQLKDIHAPIPDYKEKMEFSMDRFFSKFTTSRPIQRGSWGLEIDTPLFMPPSHPHEALRLSQLPSLPLSRIHLRVDWQTLRRLPLSGAIVFNFKALFTRLEEFRDEAHIPALCAKVLREGKKGLMEYKNTWHVEHVAIPALEEWAREQEREGKVDAGWEVRTLEESPWFPGWEEKWHKQQGF